MINMYLSMYGMSGAANTNVPQATVSQSATTKTSAPRSDVPRESERQPTPKKIYLRVPDMSGEVFKKAKNMVDIFNEGTVTVIFYDSTTAKYSEYRERLFYSEYAVNELKKIIGDDNVVVK